MALSLRGSDTGFSNNGGDVTLSHPGGTAEDDVVYVGYAIGSNGDFDMAVSTSGYTELADLFRGDVNIDANLGVFRKVMGATPDSTVVCTGTAFQFDSTAAVEHVWTGADTTTPEDATTTTATGTGTDPDPPSITTVTDGAVVLPFAGNGLRDTTVTAPTNYSNQVDRSANDSIDCTVGVASREITSAGAENPAAWTDWDGVNTGWCCATVAIRPASAGADVDITPPQGDLTVSGAAPTVDETHNRQTAQGDLTLSSEAPTVVVGVNRAPAAADLAITGPAPTVDETHNALTAQGDLTLSSVAPSVVIGIRRAPAAADLTLSGVAPTVDEAHNRQTAQGDLTLSSVAPSVVVGTNRAPAAADITISTAAPTVNETHNRQTQQGNITLSSQAPTVGVGINRAPAAGDLLISSAAPTVNEAHNRQTQQGNITLSSVAPTVAVTVGEVAASRGAYLTRTPGRLIN